MNKKLLKSVGWIMPYRHQRASVSISASYDWHTTPAFSLSLLWHHHHRQVGVFGGYWSNPLERLWQGLKKTVKYSKISLTAGEGQSWEIWIQASCLYCCANLFCQALHNVHNVHGCPGLVQVISNGRYPRFCCRRHRPGGQLRGFAIISIQGAIIIIVIINY